MTRRVVVTGGGTGIGRATARRFAREGCAVTLVGRRTDVLEAAAREIGGQVTTAGADLRDPDAVAALAADLASGGTLDVLVLNAGGNFAAADSPDEPDEPGRTLSRLADAYRADFDGNVLTTVLLGEALLPHMARPGGRVVAMSSVAGLRGAGSYGAAKAAVNAWVWDASMRVAADGVTVNSVAPGFVPDTGFWEQRLRDDPILEASRLARIPMNRAGTPDEVAEAIAYLASAGGGWTTGQILQVNGGGLLGHG